MLPTTKAQAHYHQSCRLQTVELKQNSVCLKSLLLITKTTDEFRNVGDAALSRDAYAMNHLSVEACTQVAGRGDWYPIAAATAAVLLLR